MGLNTFWVKYFSNKKHSTCFLKLALLAAGLGARSGAVSHPKFNKHGRKDQWHAYLTRGSNKVASDSESSWQEPFSGQGSGSGGRRHNAGAHESETTSLVQTECPASSRMLSAGTDYVLCIRLRGSEYVKVSYATIFVCTFMTCKIFGHCHRVFQRLPFVPPQLCLFGEKKWRTAVCVCQAVCDSVIGQSGVNSQRWNVQMFKM